MRPYPKVLALAGGMIAAVSLAAVGQQPSGQTLVVGGNILWMEKSDVSAIREGVLEKIEYQIGQRVEANKPIGTLYSESAKLTVAKAQVEAEKSGPKLSAEAKTELAASEVARLRNLEKRGMSVAGGYVSASEIAKAEAELKVAQAQIQEAKEAKELAKADLALAEQLLKEHTIKAPFTGIIVDRIKNPGESVRANEAVVKLGMIEKLKFIGYLPIESAYRVRVGDLVDVRPMIEGADLPVEQRRFRGKVIALSRELSVGRTEVTAQVVAEIENPEMVPANPADPTGAMVEVPLDLQLRPGLKADMTIYLGRTPAPAVGAGNGATTKR